ncbi:hypothetical protein MKK75_22945 [Methylobacterium sp. J-030]|uniref:hypothetical protein n=1 Tax=Methylobacterium sp. J-030 TaxID=2836627 RepID=UPI001FBAA5C4|nr:hypothetical protein [Methylobacterium sp. J-030]MCJ2071622.1 hypothetical protein [Methylobacterium sp. J-030]
MTRLIAALLILANAVPALALPRGVPAPDRYDGTWSVEIITDAGTCDRAYRYPVRIEHGVARFIGTAFTIQGSVAGNGSVRGSISNGTATANVRGRLARDGSGAGTWVASGALDCRGHWNAERRG